MNRTQDHSPPRRGRKPRQAVPAASLVGRKYLNLLQGYLADLRQCYTHPNRVLFYDDLVIVYLLSFFNPAINSLRCIEDLSLVPGVNQQLSVQALCKSTLSDANSLFDPAHLTGLIQALRQDLPELKRHDPDLQQLLDQVQVFDGSFFRLAGEVDWAYHSTRRGGKPLASFRLNCQYCLKTGTPSGLSINGDDGTGEGTAALELLSPEAEQIYLFDAGVVSFDYLKTILQAQSHFICCLSNRIAFDAQESRPLDEPAREAGIFSDSIGSLPGSQHSQPPEQSLREVKIRYTDRHGEPKVLRLVTDLVDLPAHLIAALYRHRWQIELFFRWLKVHASFRRMSSYSQNGVSLGFHIAVIAGLLTALHTQQGLSKYSQAMLGLVACGQAELEDILPILQRRERERQRDRVRQAAKKAAKNKAQA